MKNVAKNILAVVVGFLVGSFVNLGLINLGMVLVPLPEGTDASTMDGLKEAMKQFTPLNFVFPFLAHALGTLTGAYLAAKMAVSHEKLLAMGIGGFFLLGGISMIVMCGGPIWFILLDLGLAYIPMGLLGGMLAGAKSRSAPKRTETPD